MFTRLSEAIFLRLSELMTENLTLNECSKNITDQVQPFSLTLLKIANF
jgi:hypothetical protein